MTEFPQGLDDLCVRFIVNLPPEELESVERICFQVEEAQWFYEDFIRPLDPSLPPLPLRAFSLRIFQHCPLFSQWSAEHYTTAFAEFMAYKSRVPVRGAILLNDAMDECVLVKGWKKGANWSFPRGKINKDENDLDCAVREVYEETGFDLRAAGLVREEKEMKYIEQTMREQHMKLFVFSGVPKDTHFEPRTRKEISKIEWYKLTDLPTLKKHRQQDSNGGEHAGMSANKFYMVAPFLTHLKKWIAQEKKKLNRYSSNLAAPPILAEESEVERLHASLEAQHQDLIPSDLPEVTVSRSVDATAKLKELFNIGATQPGQARPQQRPSAHMPQIDAAKSTALLALLRRDPPSAELRAGPRTPLEQASFPPDIPQSPHHSHVRSPPSDNLPPPPQFHVQSELPTFSASLEHHPQPSAQALQQLPFGEAVESTGPPPGLGNTLPIATTRAPYQQTGDPDFARPRQSSQALPRVPPASALPKLTSHTKTLLDVFKGTSRPVQSSTLQQPGSSKQSLLDIFNQPTPASVSPPSSLGREHSTIPATVATARRPQDLHQSSLLDLLSPQAPQANALPATPQGKVVELSATSDHQHKPGEGRQDELLQASFRQQHAEKAYKPQAPVVKEGETAATISGPLNQPNFEAVARSHWESTDGMGRSPLTTHRTLFDPHQPTPVKIMARPQTPKELHGKSPRLAKAKMSTASPKRSGKPAMKEQTKPPFQPQILKRPQTLEGQASAGQSPAGASAAAAAASLLISRDVPTENKKASVERKLSQTDAHKQTLLSLFGGTSSPPSKDTQTPSRVVSPLSASQLVSPRDEVPVSATEPISTRSRMGSLASINGSVALPRREIEKRQTAAENRAFLLGYLGRMATQEG